MCGRFVSASSPQALVDRFGVEETSVEEREPDYNVTPRAMVPIVRGEGFHLCRILRKAEPDLDDPLVKSRAEDRILDRHFGELCAQHIRWKNLLP